MCAFDNVDGVADVSSSDNKPNSYKVYRVVIGLFATFIIYNVNTVIIIIVVIIIITSTYVHNIHAAYTYAHGHTHTRTCEHVVSFRSEIQLPHRHRLPT